MDPKLAAIFEAVLEGDMPGAKAAIQAALDAGLPDCSGVALGVDRVVMLALGAESIGEVLSFTVDRA